MMNPLGGSVLLTLVLAHAHDPLADAQGRGAR
jgi:hypothetical protein